jgi:hypothetical protein
MEWRKREAADFTASVLAPRQSVNITDEAVIPDDYVKVTRTPDKNALMADLTVGVVIPGAELVEGLPSISVRTR